MKDSVTKGFDDASCELYKQVMIKKAWLAEKDLSGNVFIGSVYNNLFPVEV